MTIARGPQDYFEGGTWNIYCSVCGKKLKFSQARRHWQGMWRCEQCWEPRPMQDFATAIRTKEMAIPYPQKESDQNIIAPAFPESGVVVTNSFRVAVIAFIYAQGANIFSIKLNNIPLSPSASSVVIPVGAGLSISYTLPLNALPPTWAWGDFSNNMLN